MRIYTLNPLKWNAKVYDVNSGKLIVEGKNGKVALTVSEGKMNFVVTIDDQEVANVDSPDSTSSYLLGK